MKVQPYDFCKPERIVSIDHLASDVERNLAGWLQDACALGPKKWGRHLPYGVEMALGRLDTLRSSEALSRLADTSLGYRVPLADEQRFTLIILPRPLVLALVGGMLGETATELPADREVSVVEESLCEFLVQDPLLATLQETWRGDPLRFGLAQREANPKWTRVFRPDENLVMSSFTLTGPFGAQEWNWLVPQNDLLKLFGLSPKPEGAKPTTEQQVITARLESLVRECRVELTVQLGTVEVLLSQLAQLRVGDVVVLDRRVTEPLKATVAGAQKFLGWPGRVGLRQALQIESPIDG